MSHRQKHPQNNQFTNHTTVKARAKEKEKARVRVREKEKVRVKEKEVTHITMITTAKEREVRTAMEKVKGKVATIMVTIIQEKVE